MVVGEPGHGDHGARYGVGLRDHPPNIVNPARAESSCARGAHRPSAVGQQRDPQSRGQQSDPLAPPRRRFGNFGFAIFRFGANDGARAFGANAGGGRRDFLLAESGSGRTLEFGRWRRTIGSRGRGGDGVVGGAGRAQRGSATGSLPNTRH